ncbi:MAG TPA: hypothetical protein VND65_12520 [Candidatus Binatia bacterium]|nr:hypothetical protein [Candidatus Binatia bacterium]
MIRSMHLGIIFILLASIAAFSQDDSSRIQVFGGYSFLHADLGGMNNVLLETKLGAPINSFNMTRNFTDGRSAEAQYNFSGWVGVAFDVNGRYGALFTGLRGVTGIPKGSEYTFLAGPVLSYPNKSRVKPYVHALFGWDRPTLNASTITGVPTPIPASATTYSDVAYAIGGGADLRVNHRFSVRLGELDWFHTSLNLDKFYSSAFPQTLFEGLSTNERNWRVTTGVVVHF